MPPIPDRPHLTISSICKSFSSTPVLKNISLTINRGEFITLLGPSGCGKTTLLRILAGLELADSGTITLAGNDLLSLPAHRRPVNTVFQSYALFPHLNVTDNIAFGLRSRRVAEAEIQPRVREALQMLQLEEFAQRPIHQLSGGQKQRVAVARAVVNQPELLLLDEPMSALDAKLRAQVQVELRALHRRLGTTFILVTHDQTEALTVSDRLFVIHQGQIAQSGTPHEIYNHPRTRFVAEFLGTTNLIHAQTPDAKPLTLAIRPEHIQIITESPNTLPATIQEIIFRGDHQELFVETCVTTDSGAMPLPCTHGKGMPPRLPNTNLSLRVRASASQSFSLHQTIHLHLPQDHLEVLHG